MAADESSVLQGVAGRTCLQSPLTHVILKQQNWWYGVHRIKDHRGQFKIWGIFISQLATAPTQNRSEGDSPNVSGQ